MSSLKLGVSLIAISAFATAAHAQTDPSSDDVIIVYGAKYKQSLEDLPASVSVTTAEEIAREPITDLYDVVERIPNINEAFGGQGFVIRGIDQRGIGSSGSGQTLTVYVDDAPLGNFTTFFGPLGAWDLGQVEVFRGPQSTNFGRNALAGAIYVRTQDPTYDTDVRARVEAGEYGLFQAAVAGGGALIEDRLAFRLSANYRETDGFIDNTFLDEDADATELQSLRGKLLFEPTETLSIISTTSYTENYAGEDVVTWTEDHNREASYDTPGREGTDTFLQSINARWSFAENWELQSITSFQSTDYTRIEDFDVTPLPIATLNRAGEDEALSQELRLKYSGDRLSGAAGFYYVEQDQEYDDDYIVPASILNPAIPSSILISRTAFFADDATNWAVFFDGEYRLTDTVDLLFGARYDSEEQTNDGRSETAIITELPPGYEFLRAYEGVEAEYTEAEYDAFLPKLGLRWSATDTTTFAFVVQKAYRAGGSEINFVDGSVEDFSPEYLWNYELSSRSRFLDDRLSVNANIFYSTWTDQQVSVPISDTITNLFRTVNAGESTLYGLETEIAYQATPELELWGSAGYVHTEFDDFPNEGGTPDNYAGNSFPFAHDWSVNAGFDYTHQSGVFGGVDVSYRSEAFTDQQNRPVNELEAVTLVNARIGYAINDHYKVTLYARNLFDEDYFTNLARANPPGAARIGDPRVVAIRLDLDF